MGHSLRGVLLALFSACVLSSAQGGLIASTDRAVFDAFLAPTDEIDFDSIPAGTVIPSGTTLSGVTISYATPGVQAMVTDAFDTASGANSLGTDDGGDSFLDGDDLTFSFDPARGFGLFIIGTADMLDNDMTLTVGSTTASLLTSAVQQFLPDGGMVWFLGIQETDPAQFFTSATLQTHGGGGAFVYNVDNIVLANHSVPEPGSAMLALVSGGGFVWRHRRKAAKRR